MSTPAAGGGLDRCRVPAFEIGDATNVRRRRSGIAQSIRRPAGLDDLRSWGSTKGRQVKHSFNSCRNEKTCQELTQRSLEQADARAVAPRYLSVISISSGNTYKEASPSHSTKIIRLPRFSIS